MAALVLGEALLRAVARPVVVDDPGAEFLGDCLRAVGRAGIHHHEIVRQAADGPDRLADPVGLVLGDDEDGNRKHGNGRLRLPNADAAMASVPACPAWPRPCHCPSGRLDTSAASACFTIGPFARRAHVGYDGRVADRSMRSKRAQFRMVKQ